jgi:transcriptional regulator
MYLPKHFQVDDANILASFIKEYPLATIIGILNRCSEINHAPLMLSADKTRLFGHLAKTNPLLQVAFQRNPTITAVFHGPNAYITPTWYPSKPASGKVVPTWNYAVVHAEGQLKLIEDPIWLREHVSKMTDIHEPTYKSNWKLEDAPEEYVQMMLKAIVGIEIQITSLVGKFKLSQNRPPEDYAGVVNALSNSPAEKLQDMLGWMSKP